jgi:hypothetical protein
MKKREISDYVSLLTYVWIKWIDNHVKSNDVKNDLLIRRKSGERCENLQRIRQKIIQQINKNFESKL